MKKTLVYLWLAALTIFTCWSLYRSRPAKKIWYTPPADYSIGYNKKRKKWERRTFNPITAAWEFSK